MEGAVSISLLRSFEGYGGVFFSLFFFYFWDDRLIGEVLYSQEPDLNFKCKSKRPVEFRKACRKLFLGMLFVFLRDMILTNQICKCDSQIRRILFIFLTAGFYFKGLLGIFD